MKQFMLDIFEQQFNYKNNTRLFFAPGRVNLIGEYTDFNGGHVLPCALTLGTYALVAPRKDRLCRLYSENFQDLGIIEISLDQLAYSDKHDWANYPKGILATFMNSGYQASFGLDIVFYGNIPNGAGLSSSASIEMVMAVVLKALFDFNLTMLEMVHLCQETENNYIGVNCGIMDQFIIGMGKSSNGVLLNTATMTYDYAELLLENYALVIANTNKRRGLEDSKYNERRRECEKALSDLNKALSLEHLCQIDMVTFERYQDLIEEAVNLNRARHVISENQRTQTALMALNQGDFNSVGQLMNASHTSLKVDFEVTGHELDTLVELAQAYDGVVGSRMTGAGFCGCTVSLIDKNHLMDFISDVGKSYKEAIGYSADFYVVEAGDGARELL